MHACVILGKISKRATPLSKAMLKYGFRDTEYMCIFARVLGIPCWGQFEVGFLGGNAGDPVL